MMSDASILLVDDDEGMLETLFDILTNINYHVEIAHNGFDAIEKVRIHTFDTVLLDLKMPGMNGVETFREIKKIRPDAVVMFVTAWSVEQIVAAALEEGAYGIMYKPIDVKRLIEFIETVKKGVLILFIDIDLSTSFNLIDILKKSGYRIAHAGSEKEAEKLVRSQRFDLVFIEVQMPIINGLEIFKSLRKIRQDIKVVMTTNYREGVEDLINQALSEGAYTCIYKPFEAEKIVKLLESILAGKIKTEI
jgi:two-component system response regulator HydG